MFRGDATLCCSAEFFGANVFFGEDRVRERATIAAVILTAFTDGRWCYANAVSGCRVARDDV